MDFKRTIIPPPWKKPIALYDSLLFLLIAGFWFSVALYDFDSLCMLDIVYLGGLFSIFFLLFSFFLTRWGKLKAEKNKVLDEVPPFVWIATAFITFLLFFVVYLLFDSGKGLEQFSSGALAFVAAVAAPFAIWRTTLTSKQTQTAIRQTDIQQQAEYRQNYLDSIKNLESESTPLRLNAIQGFKEQLKTDEKRHSLIINMLSSILYENTIETDDKGDKIEKKRLIALATLNALACRKPEWLPSGFELHLRWIIFNRNTRTGIPLDVKNLEKTDLLGANFGNTFIQNANFKGASLIRAQFTKSDLWHADFKQAVCEETNFEKANLSAADLSQATGITQEQIDLAFGDVATKLPPDLRMPPRWLKSDLDFLYSHLEWKKWMDDPEKYKPPKPPEE